MLDNVWKLHKRKRYDICNLIGAGFDRRPL
jgi:hypothetical protein